MNEAIARQVTQIYLDGWCEGERAKIISGLDEECIIIESYGPIYRGVAKIERWIDEWLGAGNTVDRWDMTSFHIAGETCFFEWVFACTYAGASHHFDGTSITRLRGKKIVYLREYQTTQPLYEW